MSTSADIFKSLGLFDSGSDKPAPTPSKPEEPQATVKTGSSGNQLVLKEAKNNPALKRWQIANPETPLHSLPFHQAADQWKKTVDPNSDLSKEDHKQAVIKAIMLHHMTHSEAREKGHVDTHGEGVLHEHGIKESYRNNTPTTVKESRSRIKTVDDSKSNPYASPEIIRYSPFDPEGTKEVTKADSEYPAYRSAGFKIMSDQMTLAKSYMEAADDFGKSTTRVDYASGNIKIPIAFSIILRQALRKINSGAELADQIEVKRDYGYMNEDRLKRFIRVHERELADQGISYEDRRFMVTIDKTDMPESNQRSLYNAGELISLTVDGVPYRLGLHYGVKELERKVQQQEQPQENSEDGQPGSQNGPNEFTSKNVNFLNDSGHPITAEITKHPKYGNINISFKDRFPSGGELHNSLTQNGFRWSPQSKVYFQRDNAKAEEWVKKHFGFGEEKQESPEEQQTEQENNETNITQETGTQPDQQQQEPEQTPQPEAQEEQKPETPELAPFMTREDHTLTPEDYEQKGLANLYGHYKIDAKARMDKAKEILDSTPSHHTSKLRERQENFNDAKARHDEFDRKSRGFLDPKDRLGHMSSGLSFYDKHKEIVEKAYREGKEIPDEVKKHYSNLIETIEKEKAEGTKHKPAGDRTAKELRDMVVDRMLMTNTGDWYDKDDKERFVDWHAGKHRGISEAIHKMLIKNMDTEPEKATPYEISPAEYKRIEQHGGDFRREVATHLHAKINGQEPDSKSVLDENGTFPEKSKMEYHHIPLHEVIRDRALVDAKEYGSFDRNFEAREANKKQLQEQIQQRHPEIAYPHHYISRLSDQSQSNDYSYPDIGRAIDTLTNNSDYREKTNSSKYAADRIDGALSTIKRAYPNMSDDEIHKLITTAPRWNNDRVTDEHNRILKSPELKYKYTKKNGHQAWIESEHGTINVGRYSQSSEENAKASTARNLAGIREKNIIAKETSEWHKQFEKPAESVTNSGTVSPEPVENKPLADDNQNDNKPAIPDIAQVISQTEPKAGKQPWEMTNTYVTSSEAEKEFPIESKVEIKDGKPRFTYSTTVKYGDSNRTFSIESASQPNASTQAERLHKKIIETAISEGKTVPPEVLKDYPELQKNNQQETQPAPAEAEPEGTVPEDIFGNPLPSTQKGLTPEHADEINNSIKKYGWSAVHSKDGIKIHNRNGKHVATATAMQNKGYKFHDTGDNLLMTGRGNIGQTADRIASQYYFAKPIEQTNTPSQPAQEPEAPPVHPLNTDIHEETGQQIQEAAQNQDQEHIQNLVDNIRHEVTNQNEEVPENKEVTPEQSELEFPSRKTQDQILDPWVEELLRSRYNKPERGGEGIHKWDPDKVLATAPNAKGKPVRRYQSIDRNDQVDLFKSLFFNIFKAFKIKDPSQDSLFDNQEPMEGQIKQFGNNPDDDRILQTTKSGVKRWVDSPQWSKLNEDMHRLSTAKLDHIKDAVNKRVTDSIVKNGKDKTVSLLNYLHDHHRGLAKDRSDEVQAHHDTFGALDPNDDKSSAAMILKHHFEHHFADEYKKRANELVRGDKQPTQQQQTKPKPRGNDILGDLFSQPATEKETAPRPAKEPVKKPDIISDLFNGRKETESVPLPPKRPDGGIIKDNISGSPARKPSGETVKPGQPISRGETKQTDGKYIPFTEYDKSGFPSGKTRFEVNLKAMTELGHTLEMQSLAAGMFSVEDIKAGIAILQNSPNKEFTYTELRDQFSNIGSVGFSRDKFNVMLTQMPIQSVKGDTMKYDPDHSLRNVLTREITPEMQQVLKSYTGWGGTQIKDANEFYTPHEVIQSQWKAMRELGFKGGVILEPSCGTGRYIDNRDTDTVMIATELDPISATIAKITHNQDHVSNLAFEEFCRKNKFRFNGTVANVPFGERQVIPQLDKTPVTMGTHEDFFVYKSLENGAEGSIHSFIVPTGFLENKKLRMQGEMKDDNIAEEINKPWTVFSQGDSVVKAIQAYGEFIGAARLPNKTFQKAGTSVTSDMVFFRRRPDAVVAQLMKSGFTTSDGVLSPELFDKRMSDHYFNVHPEHVIGEETTGNWGTKAAKGEFDPEHFDRIIAELKQKKSPDYAKVLPGYKPGQPEQAPKEGTTRDYQGKDWIYRNGKWHIKEYKDSLADFGEMGYKNIFDLKSKLEDIDHAQTATPDILRLANHPAIVSHDPKLKGFLNGLADAVDSIPDEHRQKTLTGMLLGKIIQNGFRSAANNEPWSEGRIKQITDAAGRFSEKYGNPKDDIHLKEAAKRNAYAGVFASLFDEDGKLNPVVAGVTLSGQRVPVQKFDKNDPGSIASSLYHDGSGLSIKPDQILTHYTGDKKAAEIETHLLDDPNIGFDGEGYLPFAHATSGMIYEKLDKYRNLLEDGKLSRAHKGKLDQQIKTIEATKPHVPFEKIDGVSLQSPYIPTEMKNEFFKEMFGVDNWEIKHLNGATILDRTEKESRSTWRQKPISEAHDQVSVTAMEDFLNGTLRKGMNDEFRQLDSDFKDYLETNPEHMKAIESNYARMYQNYVEPQYDMTPIDIPGFVKVNPKSGSKEYVLHPYQYQTIRKMNATGRGIMSLDVGLGKTASAIALAAYDQARGAAKRTAFTVEVNNIGKWYTEIKEWHPEANIAVVGQKFVTDKSGKIQTDIQGYPMHTADPDWETNLAKIATGGFSHVIIPHTILSPSSTSNRFLSLGTDNYLKQELKLLKMTTKGIVQELATASGQQLPPNFLDEITSRSELAEKLESFVEMVNSDPTSKKDDNAKREFKEKTLNKLQKTIEQIMEANPTHRPGTTGYGNMLSFENLGVDQLFVDESHNFKSLFSEPSSDQRSSNSNMGQTSNAAINMFMLTNHLLDTNNKRGVYFMTATPITAKPHEAFNVMSMIAPDVMKSSYGIDNATDFINRFGNVEPQYSFDTRGNLEQKPMLTGFKEANGLRNFLYRFLDVKTAANATIWDENNQTYKKGLPIPEEEHLKHITPMTDFQKTKLNEYLGLIAVINGENGKLPPYIKVDKKGRKKVYIDTDTNKEVNSPTVMQWAERVCIDPNFDEAAEGGGSHPDTERFNKVVSNMLESYRNGGKQVGFMDGFNQEANDVDTKGIRYFDRIKQKLVDGGIPENEIAIITGNMDANERYIKSLDYKHGKLKIILGSSAIETGMDLHIGTTDLHHLDMPWNSTSMQQRNGRAVRQGNKQPKVRIHHYFSEGGYDYYKDMVQRRKADMLDHLYNGKSDFVKTSNEDTIDRVRTIAMLSPNPEKATRDLEDRIGKFENRKEASENEKLAAGVYKHIKASKIAERVGSNLDRVKHKFKGENYDSMHSFLANQFIKDAEDTGEFSGRFMKEAFDSWNKNKFKGLHALTEQFYKNDKPAQINAYKKLKKIFQKENFPRVYSGNGWDKLIKDHKQLKEHVGDSPEKLKKAKNIASMLGEKVLKAGDTPYKDFINMDQKQIDKQGLLRSGHIIKPKDDNHPNTLVLQGIRNEMKDIPNKDPLTGKELEPTPNTANLHGKGMKFGFTPDDVEWSDKKHDYLFTGYIHHVTGNGEVSSYRTKMYAKDIDKDYLVHGQHSDKNQVAKELIEHYNQKVKGK